MSKLPIGRRHKHKYGVYAVKRSSKRGMVIVKYRCSNTTSYCDKPLMEKTEPADKYQ